MPVCSICGKEHEHGITMQCDDCDDHLLWMQTHRSNPRLRKLAGEILGLKWEKKNVSYMRNLREGTDPLAGKHPPVLKERPVVLQPEMPGRTYQSDLLGFTPTPDLPGL